MSNFLFLLLLEAEILMYKTVFHFLPNTMHNWTEPLIMPYFLCSSAPIPCFSIGKVNLIRFLLFGNF